MALHADAQLYGATDKMKAISYNTYLVEKINKISPTAEQIRKVDTMIRQMEASLETLASDIRKVDKAYTSYKARNYLSFGNKYERFLDRVDIYSSVFLTVIVLGIALVAVFLHNFVNKGIGKEA